MTLHAIAEPPLRLFWFLPTAGDGPYLGSQEQWRPSEFGYLQAVAQAADRLGFGRAAWMDGPWPRRWGL